MPSRESKISFGNTNARDAILRSGFERPIAIAHGVIAAPDCIHFLCFSRANRRKPKNPSMQNPGGKAFSQEKSL